MRDKLHRLYMEVRTQSLPCLKETQEPIFLMQPFGYAPLPIIELDILMCLLYTEQGNGFVNHSRK